MVAQQILRVSVAVLSLSLGPLAVAQDKLPVTGEEVVVVDLRAPTSANTQARGILVRGLQQDPRVRVVARSEETKPAWSAFLARARKALADLDCPRARSQSQAAIIGLSTEHALGKPVRAELTTAYATWLRCAQPGDAELIIQRLRALGHQVAPKAVPPGEWNRAPAVDAQAGTVVVALEIDSDPTGATVWLDHQRVGTAPLQIGASPGLHVVSVVADGRGQSRSVDATGKATKVLLQLGSKRTSDASPALAAEKKWRAANRPPSPSEVGKLLNQSKKRIALLIMPGGQVHIWAIPKSTRFARRVSGAPANNAKYVAKLVNEWVQAEDGAGVDPAFPLMREDPDAKGKKKRKSTKWWVYAGVGAAVTFASVLILADQFADDRQRIELTIP